MLGVVNHVKSLGKGNRFNQRAMNGKCWLKPRAILCERGTRVETVEWSGGKLCINLVLEAEGVPEI